MSEESEAQLPLSMLLTEMLEETGGPLDEAEQRAADEELGIPDQQRRD